MPDLPEPKPVRDRAGLVRIESHLQVLAAGVDGVLREVGIPEWRFALLVFEIEGGANTYVSSDQRDGLVEVLRAQADRLAATSGVSNYEIRAVGSEGLSVEAMQRLAQGAHLAADVIGESLPAGWGFALLLYHPSRDPTRGAIYVSNAEREGAVAFFRETAALLELGRDVPPGQL